MNNQIKAKSNNIRQARASGRDPSIISTIVSLVTIQFGWSGDPTADLVS